MGIRTEGWILAGAGAVAAGLVVAGWLLVPPAPAPMTLPAAGDLLALDGYLAPVPGADARPGVPPPVSVEGSPFGPLASAPTPARGPTGAAPGPAWAVTAIMITGARRIAIVNDRLVRPGDRLADGSRIAAVEADHVLLITPSGERRRLELER